MVGAVGGSISLRRKILAGRHALGALEYPREIELVKEAYRHRDLGNGKVACAQQLAGFVDAVFGKIIDGALAYVQHEHAVQVTAGDTYAFCHIINGNIV